VRPERNQVHDSINQRTDAKRDLLIACARMQTDPNAADRIRSLVENGADWDLLFEAAWLHGMVPLLYSNLKSICPDEIPAEVLDKLKNRALETHKKNLFLSSELVRILNLFKADGISAIAYKGPTVAALIYGNLALRRFSDLDILVRKQDFARARDLLMKEGYEPELKISPARHNAFLKVNYVQLFERNDGRAVVELHWGVAPRNFAFSLDVASLWQRAQEIELLGQKILMPCAEDLILLLCIHGTKDLWDRLEWIYGVAELIRTTPALDWEKVLAEARRTFSTRMLLLGLALAHKLIGTTLPDKLLKEIEADSSVPLLVQLVEDRLFRNDNSYALGFRMRFHLKARERLLDRVRYCVRLAFTTSHGDWEIIPLPAPLSFLYYFIRPVRLLKNYTRLSNH
jgi:hypothetical protein